VVFKHQESGRTYSFEKNPHGWDLEVQDPEKEFPIQNCEMSNVEVQRLLTIIEHNDDWIRL
jgi:hypothetical protein